MAQTVSIVLSAGDRILDNLQHLSASSESVSALAPDDALSFLTRGLAAIHRAEWRSGVEDLRQAFDINPNDIVIVYLSFAEARAGNTDRAIELADRAIRINPRSAEVGTCYLAKGMCAFIDGDMAELQRWSALAIQIQPSAPIRRILMVIYAIEAGDDTLKAEHFAPLDRHSPNFIRNLFSGAYRPFEQDQHIGRLLDILRKGGLEP